MPTPATAETFAPHWIGGGMLAIGLRSVGLPAPALTGLIAIAFGATLVGKARWRSPMLLLAQLVVYMLLYSLLAGVLFDAARTTPGQLLVLLDAAGSYLLGRWLVTR